MDSKEILKNIYRSNAEDIRVVKSAYYPSGAFITGSSDTLVKLWVPSDDGEYRVEHEFIGAKKFIASLCSVPPSVLYPKGLILAGSNDCAIYGFTLQSKEPVLKLLGHSNTVCTLSAGFGLVVSGSWDGTARVWSGEQCIAVLEGHNQSVWAAEVCPLKNIVTGSADNTLRIWCDGICENILEGHRAGVRGLVVTKDLTILSCSDDTTVRLWNMEGICLNIFLGHERCIYSITLLNNGIDFATCGEDESIIIWEKRDISLRVRIPSIIPMSISCLKNDNLIVSCSDGSVCVLEKVPEATNQTDTHSKRDDIVTKIIGYEWNPMKNKWVQVKSANQDQSSADELDFMDKPTKKKDFEFYCVVEGKLCKLEINKNENPCEVASKFIADHKLDPSYLNDIQNYIVKNCDAYLPPGRNAFFPSDKYYTYLNADIRAVKVKLLEFTNFVQKSQHVPPANIEMLSLLANFPDEVTEEQMQSLDTIITWNDEYLFPALDLLRLAVRCKGVGARVGNVTFINNLLQILRSTKIVINRVSVIKIFCNLFEVKECLELMITNQEKILDTVKETLFASHKVEKATSSLILNYSVAAYSGLPVNIESYCVNVIQVINAVKDFISLHKIFVAIGTLSHSNYAAFMYFKSLKMNEILLSLQTRVEVGNTLNILKILLRSFDA
ncbi:phospholipase A-2-activating protein [Trichonephila clavata]|uniref:Phospholipase A-2-activating protein n=1 Tax=Trichonephila clavata TaxID=2740835 RepID=A0A8X6F2R9_TRICU|nr:phospholipase A-2-activating protein [Trichonephila clavata]